MQATDNQAFSRTLDGVFDVYGRQAPSAEARLVWWRILQPYPLEAVSRALGLYTRTEPKYPPTPAQILELLGEGHGDGRPDADEAWSIALQAQDEQATVVWNQDIAAAYGAARPILDAGDEVGARMAFRAAYNRVVTEARRAGQAVQWMPSLGLDAGQRVEVLERAVEHGMLPAPAVAGLLAGPKSDDGAEPDDEVAAANLHRIRSMLADALARRGGGSKRVEAERERLQALKAAAAAKVEAHQARTGS